MKTFPIIPIWLMLIICIILIIVIIKNNKKNINQIIIVIILFLINLRIMIQTDTANIEEKNVEVLFAIDNTISMIAEDYNGANPRLEGVKEDCKFIIDNLIGAKFSIITFNNSAKILIPFTLDSNLAKDSIDIIEPIEELYARGTSLNTPIETIEDILKRASEKNKDTKRLLFFISDGEITDESKLKSFSNIKKYINDGAVLGYGTKKGGNMLSINRYIDNREYIMDYSDLDYKKAVSKIDENNLNSIAKDLGISYIHMNNQRNLNSKLKTINKNIDSSLTTINKDNYDDTYYILIIPLLILIVLEFKKIRGN